jgi:aspartyl-tRNA(Asn)/glutamyl-tRNA(Gln) amidotransferase subunit C
LVHHPLRLQRTEGHDLGWRFSLGGLASGVKDFYTARTFLRKRFKTVAKTYSASSEHIDVEYVAHLARVYLTPEEVGKFQSQLDDILAYVDSIKALDVEGIEPTAHAIPIQNVMREDEVRPSLDHERVMQNAPAVYQGQFEVPPIIE